MNSTEVNQALLCHDATGEIHATHQLISRAGHFHTEAQANAIHPTGLHIVPAIFTRTIIHPSGLLAISIHQAN